MKNLFVFSHFVWKCIYVWRPFTLQQCLSWQHRRSLFSPGKPRLFILGQQTCLHHFSNTPRCIDHFWLWEDKFVFIRFVHTSPLSSYKTYSSYVLLFVFFSTSQHLVYKTYIFNIHMVQRQFSISFKLLPFFELWLSSRFRNSTVDFNLPFLSFRPQQNMKVNYGI